MSKTSILFLVLHGYWFLFLLSTKVKNYKPLSIKVVINVLPSLKEIIIGSRTSAKFPTDEHFSNKMMSIPNQNLKKAGTSVQTRTEQKKSGSEYPVKSEGQ
jgi:hypothetical protein